MCNYESFLKNENEYIDCVVWENRPLEYILMKHEDDL